MANVVTKLPAKVAATDTAWTKLGLIGTPHAPGGVAVIKITGGSGYFNVGGDGDTSVNALFDSVTNNQTIITFGPSSGGDVYYKSVSGFEFIVTV